MMKNIPTDKEARRRANEIRLEKYNNIKVERISRIDYILKEIDGCYDTVDDYIELIKYFDNILPGKKYFIEVSNDKNKMTYSDEFIEDLLKKEFINHLSKNV